MLFGGFFTDFDAFLSKKRAKTGLFDALFWHFRAKNSLKRLILRHFERFLAVLSQGVSLV